MISMKTKTTGLFQGQNQTGQDPWTLVTRKKHSKASRAKTSLAKVPGQEFWKEEEMISPAFKLKISKKPTRSEKKKQRMERLKNLNNFAVFRPEETKSFSLKEEDFPPLERKHEPEEKNSSAHQNKESSCLQVSSSSAHQIIKGIKKAKNTGCPKIKKAKQQLKKAIRKRLEDSLQDDQWMDIPCNNERFLRSKEYTDQLKKTNKENSKNKKEQINPKTENRLQKKKMNLMGGAPPQKKRKIPLRLVSIDERIEILKCDLAAQKTSTRLEKIRYNTLERQLQQTMKLKEKEELKGDFSNMYQNFEKDVLTPESSVFGDTSQCQSDLQSEASEEVVPNVLCLSNPMGENLCYQNAVYSLLASIPEFLEKIQDVPKKSEFLHMVKKVFLKNKAARAWIAQYLQYKPGTQNDSTEFLQDFLKKIANIDPSVKSLFSIKSTTKNTCIKHGDQEGSTKIDSEPFECILYKVRVPKETEQLQDILDKSLKISKDNLYPCAICGGTDDVPYKTTTVITSESSEYLLIHLDRTLNHNEKRQTAIQISSVNFNKSRYKLVGGIVHHGKKPKPGHYTSIVSIENVWWHVDDDKKIEVDDPTTFLKTATLLLMKREQPTMEETTEISSPIKSVHRLAEKTPQKGENEEGQLKWGTDQLIPSHTENFTPIRRRVSVIKATPPTNMSTEAKKMVSEILPSADVPSSSLLFDGIKQLPPSTPRGGSNYKKVCTPAHIIQEVTTSVTKAIMSSLQTSLQTAAKDLSANFLELTPFEEAEGSFHEPIHSVQPEVTLAQDKQKLCFCKTTSHRCRVCQKLVCVECSVGDSEDEVKRFHPDCLRKAKKPTKTISSQESCLETIPEEMSELPNLQLKPVQEEEPQQCEDTAEPFIFKKGSVSDVTYIGKKSQKEWNKESLYTTYILVPDELVHMVRMVPNSGATIEDLRCYLLRTLDGISGLNLNSVPLTYKNEPVETLDSLEVHQGRCLVWTESKELNHGGSLWSCETCSDKKTDLMRGSNSRRMFLKSHKDHKLFQEKILEGKLPWGDSSKLDKNARPYAHPKMEGVPQRFSKKYVALNNPVLDVKESSKAELISQPESEERRRILRPKTKRKMVIYSDSDEEEDREPEFNEESDTLQSEKKKRDPKISKLTLTKKGNLRKGSTTSTDYKIPEGFPLLEEARQKRRKQMLDARRQASDGSDFSYNPEEEELSLIKKLVISKVIKGSIRYELGQGDLDPDSRAQINEGEMPEADQHVVPKTADHYLHASKKLMHMLQLVKEKRLHFSDFFAFGSKNLIRPYNISEDLERYQFATVGVKSHMIYVYQHIINLQSSEAEKNYMKFSPLVPDFEKMTEDQLDHAAHKEAGSFKNDCAGTVHLIKNTGAKSINKGRTAQAVQNKKTSSEMKGEKVPDPVVFLPKYFQDFEIQELDRRLLVLGTDPNKKVTSKDIVDLTEHVLVTLTLKNGNRIQCISQAKNSEYIDALKGRKVYYPYRPKTPNELDEDNGDDNDLPEMRDWKFDDKRSENVPDEHSYFVKGIVMEIDFHKTAGKGPAKVYLSQTDMARIDLYRAVVEKYSEEKGLDYKVDGPLFVNSEMTSWHRNGKRQLTYRIWSRVCGIPKFKSHMCRYMFASFASQQRNLLVQELAAMAASHSRATQQQTYRSEALRHIQHASVSDFYRRQCRLLEDEEFQSSKLPYISDKYAAANLRDFEEVARLKEQRFLRQEDARERGEVVTASRMTQLVKYQIIHLVTMVGDDLGVSLPEDLMTGKETRNVKNKQNFLMALDWASCKRNAELESVWSDLTENLLEVTKQKAEEDEELSDEEFINICENFWLNKVVGLFYNMSSKVKTYDISSLRLKKLLAELNLNSNYRYCFGNDEVARVLKLYNEHIQKQKDDIEKTANRDKSHTAQDSLRKHAEQAKRREEEDEAKQSDLQDGQNQEPDDLDAFFDNPPEATGAAAMLRSVSTEGNPAKPRKELTLDIEDHIVSVQITPKGKWPARGGDNTPAKLLRGESAELRSKASSNRGGLKMYWTHQMRIQWLGLWIEWSDYPFIHNHAKTGVRDMKDYRSHLFNSMMNKATMIVVINGQSVRRYLGEITASEATLWDKLYHVGSKLAVGGKLAARGKMLDFLHEKMKHEYGTDYSTWTAKQARDIRKSLLEDLYAQFGRPDPESDEVAS